MISQVCCKIAPRNYFGNHRSCVLLSTVVRRRCHVNSILSRGAGKVRDSIDSSWSTFGGGDAYQVIPEAGTMEVVAM